MTDEKNAEPFAGWCILELMRHRRLGGYVREVQLAGVGFLRLDIGEEADGSPGMTQFYPPSSVYCLTPCSQPAARAVARANRPEPVSRYELPKLTTADLEGPSGEFHDGFDDDDG